MKKTIFLVDADDTLLDFHGSSALALRHAFAACHLQWKDRYADDFKRINDGLWEALERKELTRAELIEKRFPYYLSELGLQADGNAFNQYYLHGLATKPMYVQGAEEFLQKLVETGRVFIVTNGTEYIQKSRFDIIGLWKYAEDVFISDTIGIDKPAKGYTAYVTSHIKAFDKEKTVWIGDSLSADIKAANEAGITSIWFNPNNKPVNNKANPDYIAADFNKIVEIVENFCD